MHNPHACIRCVLEVLLGLFSLHLLVETTYASGSIPFPTPIPAIPPSRNPPFGMPPLTTPPLANPQTAPALYTRTYEGITSQGQRFTIFVENGLVTLLQMRVQLGVSAFYVAMHHGNLGTVSGSRFQVTIDHAEEYLFVEGDLSKGAYGEPPRGTFHFVSKPALNGMPTTEVFGTWRLLGTRT